MPGAMDRKEVALAIPDFDCVAHVPSSENCGGVVEPFLCGIPVIASRIGGLVEVVLDGITGATVQVHDPRGLADAILQVREQYADACRRGKLAVRWLGQCSMWNKLEWKFTRFTGICWDRPKNGRSSSIPDVLFRNLFL